MKGTSFSPTGVEFSAYLPDGCVSSPWRPLYLKPLSWRVRSSLTRFERHRRLVEGFAHFCEREGPSAPGAELLVHSLTLFVLRVDRGGDCLTNPAKEA